MDDGWWRMDGCVDGRMHRWVASGWLERKMDGGVVGSNEQMSETLLELLKFYPVPSHSFHLTTHQATC